MNENFKAFINNISVTISSILGIIGAQTDNSAFQVLAFIPTIFEKATLNICEKKANHSEEISKEIKQVVQDACNETCNELFRNNKKLSYFLENVSARIEYQFSSENLSFNSLDKLKQIIEEEGKWSDNEYPSNYDINVFVVFFTKKFMMKLLNSQKLSTYFVTNSLIEQDLIITEIQNSLNEMNDKINKLQKENLIQKYYDDNKEYKNKFVETLFLHTISPDKKHIRLCDIFTIPEVISFDDNNEERKNVIDIISDFVAFQPDSSSNNPINIMFIEGQAAMGKSSLVSYLAWNYCQKTDVAKGIFGDKKLITIRLRDLLQYQTVLNTQAPLSDIYKYLFCGNGFSREECKKLFSNCVLVLDGFDELCMVENINDPQSRAFYFSNLNRQLNAFHGECKVIITTRPTYLFIDQYDFPKKHVLMLPFSKQQRQNWIENYEKISPISSDVKSKLSGEFDEVFASIVDTPLVLYMIVAKGICVSEDMDIWELYYRVFLVEVYKKNYDKNCQHGIAQYEQYFHRLTAEIAKYLLGERKFFVTIEQILEVEEIQKLVDNLTHESYKNLNKNEKVQKILTDCFGIASYFKTIKVSGKSDIKKSAIEFYHNNIRDFFCCEYIWFFLQRVYEGLQGHQGDSDEWFMCNFQKEFQFISFPKDSGTNSDTNMILKFLSSKVHYFIKNNIREAFLVQELNNSYFKSFFGKMLSTGMLYEYKYDGKTNILEMMVNIYVSVLSIYKIIYSPFLKHGVTLPVTSTKEQKNAVGTSFIYRHLILMSNIHDNSFLNFDGIMFSGIEFENHNFYNSSFVGCLLIRCNFTDCDLRGTDFSGSDLSYADFRNAIIDFDTRFDGAIFCETRINDEQKKYFPETDISKFIIE